MIFLSLKYLALMKNPKGAKRPAERRPVKMVIAMTMVFSFAESEYFLSGPWIVKGVVVKVFEN